MQRELGQEKKCLGSGHRAVDFDANKKNAGRKINRTPEKNPLFSSPVNQRNPRSSAF